MENINIYVIMHKVINLEPLYLDKCYKELLVGKNECENKEIQLDSTGDNISNKNSNYCELTGLYWIWKNSNSDVVGLCHYRRFFISKKSKKIMTEKEITENLLDYDIILAKRWKSLNNVYDIYKKNHNIEDLEKCKEIISEYYPEYCESFNKVIYGREMYPLNMFICSKELINEYCMWLFDIFNKLEAMIDLSDRDAYQKRLYGFLSERLLNVWVDYKKLNVYESPFVNTEEKSTTKVKRAIKNSFVRILRKIKE